MVKYVRVFDDEYVSSEYVQELGSTPQGATVLTAEQLLSKIQNDYPFHINVVTAQATLGVGQSSSISIRFGWAYETGDDETDTDYGTRAYDYYEDNNGEPVIQAIIRITVVQHPDQTQTPAAATN